ncbi:MAG: DUF3516 domain-containing protein [Polyangiaceae bacterium]|nr:DUF3516 domain-containing protein [Polyangiaceae bacterium]
MSRHHPLAALLADLKTGSGDELLERFITYVTEMGLELYPAQEEAILEILAGKNVILSTPTGSGKSLVATAMIFRTLANAGRAFYTCPIKALVNEKFFHLTDAFGPKMVGMMTGDAAINVSAPIICCTAEIASSMALREGVAAPIDALVMDEFHYYSDKDRGIAWQLPLLILERTRFLLMSATLGDPKPFLDRLEGLTKRPAALVESRDRPVPLDFTYSEEPLHEVVKGLVEKSKSPIYIVCFTQRACAEEAQNLMSENYTTKEEKKAILEALQDVSFDSPYGKEVQRFVKHGIGLHHAGLLPKYRLLVEKLSQQGLLKVICGTDTLGVGVNIPIRTVLFTKLCKFDGEKVTILSVREFQQIAGRAGRKGFDVQGSVVAQAPEHVIENVKIDAKKASDPKKHKNLQRAKPPTKGYVHWDRTTFDRLVASRPEELVPRFSITHGMLIDLLDNPEVGKGGGYGMLLELITRSHVPERDKRRERKQAPLLFRALRRAGIIELAPRPSGKRGKLAIVSTNLQRDFSLNHALSLWLVDFVGVLSETKESEHGYALDVLSAVEAVLESPRAILERQVDKLRGEKVAELKAAGVEYEERMAQLEKVDYPKPNAELIYETFDTFAKFHPWASVENVRPKSIARDMFERFATFDEYIREYDLSRMEGVLLRYLSDAVKTLEQGVPAKDKNDELDALYWFLRDEVRGVDSSLLDEWEGRLHARHDEARATSIESAPRLADDPKALLVRVRKDLHRLLKLLATRNFEDASKSLANAAEWPAARIQEAMGAFFEKKRTLIVHHEARRAEFTTMRQTHESGWDAWQTMVDPEGENDWAIEAFVDLAGDVDETGPLLQLRRIAET